MILTEIRSVGEAGGQVGHARNAQRIGLPDVVRLIQMMAGEQVEHQMRIGRGLKFSFVFLYGFGEVSSAELRNRGASKVNGEILAFLCEETDEPVFGGKLVGA